MNRLARSVTRLITANCAVRDRTYCAKIVSTRNLSNGLDDNAGYQTDFQLMSVRNMTRTANLLTNHKKRCLACGGSGFHECDLCIRGCWRCQRSTWVRCRECNGLGDIDHPHNKP